jgi:formate dehydrogenase major subunit
MVKEILEGSFYTANHYYLTTGRILAHYNNTAQTKQSEKLNSKYPQDIVLASYQDKESFAGEWVILKTQYGETSPLKVEFSDNIKPKTLYTTFHHAASRINAIFGDECDALILTPRFKSIRVEIVSL